MPLAPTIGLAPRAPARSPARPVEAAPIAAVERRDEPADEPAAAAAEQPVVATPVRPRVDSAVSRRAGFNAESLRRTQIEARAAGAAGPAAGAAAAPAPTGRAALVSAAQGRLTSAVDDAAKQAAATDLAHLALDGDPAARAAWRTTSASLPPAVAAAAEDAAATTWRSLWTAVDALEARRSTPASRAAARTALADAAAKGNVAAATILASANVNEQLRTVEDAEDPQRALTGLIERAGRGEHDAQKALAILESRAAAQHAPAAIPTEPAARARRILACTNAGDEPLPVRDLQRDPAVQRASGAAAASTGAAGDNAALADARVRLEAAARANTPGARDELARVAAAQAAERARGADPAVAKAAVDELVTRAKDEEQPAKDALLALVGDIDKLPKETQKALAPAAAAYYAGAYDLTTQEANAFVKLYGRALEGGDAATAAIGKQRIDAASKKRGDSTNWALMSALTRAVTGEKPVAGADKLLANHRAYVAEGGSSALMERAARGDPTSINLLAEAWAKDPRRALSELSTQRAITFQIPNAPTIKDHMDKLVPALLTQVKGQTPPAPGSLELVAGMAKELTGKAAAAVQKETRELLRSHLASADAARKDEAVRALATFGGDLSADDVKGIVGAVGRKTVDVVAKVVEGRPLAEQRDVVASLRAGLTAAGPKSELFHGLLQSIPQAVGADDVRAMVAVVSPQTVGSATTILAARPLAEQRDVLGTLRADLAATGAKSDLYHALVAKAPAAAGAADVTALLALAEKERGARPAVAESLGRVVANGPDAVVKDAAFSALESRRWPPFSPATKAAIIVYAVGIDAPTKIRADDMLALNAQTLFKGRQGPDWESITQRDTNDCWFVAATLHVAKTDPELIKRMIRDDGDGRYTVTFPGVNKLYSVEAPKPNDTGYGTSNGCWLSVLERAWAEHLIQTGPPGLTAPSALDCARMVNEPTLDVGNPAAGMRAFYPPEKREMFMVWRPGLGAKLGATAGAGLVAGPAGVLGVGGAFVGDWLTQSSRLADKLESAMIDRRAVTAGTNIDKAATAVVDIPIGGVSRPDLLSTGHVYTVIGFRRDRNDTDNSVVVLRNPYGGSRPPTTPNGVIELPLKDFIASFGFVGVQTR